MLTGKTSPLSFRIVPALKRALRAVGEREHRSIANKVEALIRDWCGPERHRDFRAAAVRSERYPRTRQVGSSYYD